jgi:hypothetical protein
MLVFQGDVICLRVLDQVIIVLSSISAVKDLLEKRGEAYADRPSLPILDMCAHPISFHPPIIVYRADIA